MNTGVPFHFCEFSRKQGGVLIPDPHLKTVTLLVVDQDLSFRSTWGPKGELSDVTTSLPDLNFYICFSYEIGHLENFTVGFSLCIHEAVIDFLDDTITSDIRMMQTTWSFCQDQLICITVLVFIRIGTNDTIIDLYCMHS